MLGPLYILDENGEPKIERDTDRWMEWMRANHSQEVLQVALTEVREGLEVSTVFLWFGIHFLTDETPRVWETMIFDAKEGPLNNFQRRCGGSREQAQAMHAQAVRMAEYYVAEGVVQQSY